MNTLKDLLGILKEMTVAEKAVSDFYAACAGKFSESRGLWKDMSIEELNHAETLKGICDAIQSTPADFSPGRPFAMMALKTFIAGVAQNTEKISKGEISQQKAFAIARDLENSLIEFKYSEIVKSKNIKYRNILNSLSADEIKHKSRLSGHN